MQIRRPTDACEKRNKTAYRRQQRSGNAAYQRFEHEGYLSWTRQRFRVIHPVATQDNVRDTALQEPRRPPQENAPGQSRRSAVTLTSSELPIDSSRDSTRPCTGSRTSTSHDPIADRKKDERFLKERWIRTLRLSNEQVLAGRIPRLI